MKHVYSGLEPLGFVKLLRIFNGIRGVGGGLPWPAQNLGFESKLRCSFLAILVPSPKGRS